LLAMPQPPGIAPEDDALQFVPEYEARRPWGRSRRI